LSKRICYICLPLARG